MIITHREVEKAKRAHFATLPDPALARIHELVENEWVEAPTSLLLDTMRCVEDEQFYRAYRGITATGQPIPTN